LETLGIEDTINIIRILLNIAEVLQEKFMVTITNPPYMGSGEMDSLLSEYVKKHFVNEKADMSTVFMSVCSDMCCDHGVYSMINIPVWMFISSFEKLRKKLLMNDTIINMIHPGRGIFGSDFGTTTFTIHKGSVSNYKGVYYRLFNKQGDVDSVEERRRQFLLGKGKHYIAQRSFEKIPGEPIAYWLSENLTNQFSKHLMQEYAIARIGLATGNNDHYLRLWHEVSFSNIGFNYTREQARESCYKWFPYNKGGAFRKWFGNRSYVIDWSSDGKELQTTLSPDGKRIWAHNFNLDYIFKPNISWSDITISTTSFRAFEKGFVFDSCGTAAFVKDEKDYYYLLGYLNTNLVNKFIAVLNPTIHFTPGDFANLPVIVDNDAHERVVSLVKENISITTTDWNSFESSWNFSRHPLIRGKQIEDAYEVWQCECKNRFIKLKNNEEELNSIFIQMFNVQEEILPTVNDSEISIQIADLSRDIRSLISYAIGCMFGRYSVDVDGLAYAGGDWDASKYSNFIPDVDNVIPITDEDYFDDDIVGLLIQWLKKVYGEETIEENLDFIAKALGNKGNTSREIIRNYFLTDFFKDHCQTYSVTGSGKRPIYWLYDSGKQNGFKALIYMHRYNEDTTGVVRVKYLHRMDQIYMSEIDRMQDTIDHSKSAHDVSAASKRKEKLQKQLKECRDYDEKIAHLALDRIAIDLDDGVKVNYRKVQTGSDGKFYEVLADSKNIMAKER